MADDKNLQDSSPKHSIRREEKGSILSYFKQKSTTPVKTKCEDVTDDKDVGDEIMVIGDPLELKANPLHSNESLKLEKVSNSCTNKSKETAIKSCVNAENESIGQKNVPTETSSKSHMITTGELAKQKNVFAFMMNNRNRQNEAIRKMAEEEKADNEAKMEEKMETSKKKEPVMTVPVMMNNRNRQNEVIRKMAEQGKADNKAQMKEKMKTGKTKEPVMMENVHDGDCHLRKEAGIMKELTVNLVRINTSKSKVKRHKNKDLKKDDENMDANNEKVLPFCDIYKAEEKKEVASESPISDDELEIIMQKEADKTKKIDSYFSKMMLPYCADSKQSSVENGASKVLVSAASSMGNAFAVLMTNRHKMNRNSSATDGEISEETKEHRPNISGSKRGTGKRGRKRKRSTSEEFNSSLLDFEVTPKKKKKGRKSRGESLGSAKRMIKKNLTYDSEEDEEEVIVARKSKSRNFLNAETNVDERDTVIKGSGSGSTSSSGIKDESEFSLQSADTVLDSEESEVDSECKETGESETEFELEESAKKEIEYDSEETCHSEFENIVKGTEVSDAEYEEEEEDDVNALKSEIEDKQMLKDEVKMADDGEEIEINSQNNDNHCGASKEGNKPVVEYQSNSTVASVKEEVKNTCHVNLTAEADNTAGRDCPSDKKTVCENENDRIPVESEENTRKCKQPVDLHRNVTIDVKGETNPLHSPGNVKKCFNDSNNIKKSAKLSKQKNTDGNSSVDITSSGTACRVSSRIANTKKVDDSSSECLVEPPVKRRKRVDYVESNKEDDDGDEKNVSNQDSQETKSVSDSKSSLEEEGMAVSKKGSISSFFKKITKEEKEVKRSKNIITIKADVHASYDGTQQSNKLTNFVGKGTEKDKFKGNRGKESTRIEKKSTRRSSRRMKKELEDFNKIELLEQIAIASPKKQLPVEESSLKLPVRKKILECTKETGSQSSQVTPAKNKIGLTSKGKNKRNNINKRNIKKASKVKLRKASGNSLEDTTMEERSKAKQTLLGKNIQVKMLGNKTEATKSSSKVRKRNLKINRSAVKKQNSLRKSRSGKKTVSPSVTCDQSDATKDQVSENLIISNSNNSPESSSDEIFFKKRKTARSVLQKKSSSTLQEVTEDKENIASSRLECATVIREGSHFRSFAEFEQRLQEFKQAENVQLKIRDSRTIASIKDKAKRKTFNQTLRYKDLIYVCAYSSKILLEQFKGSNRKPFSWCTFKINLRTAPDRQTLFISKICCDHNHDLDEEEGNEENSAVEVHDCSEEAASPITHSLKKREQRTGKIVRRKLLGSQDNINNQLGTVFKTPKVNGSKVKKISPKGKKRKLSLKKKITDLQDEVIQEMAKASSVQVNMVVESDTIIIDDDSSPKVNAKAQVPKKQKLLPMVLKPPPKEMKSSKLKANKKSPKRKSLNKESKGHVKMASAEGTRRPSRKAAVIAKRFMEELSREDDLTIMDKSNDKGKLQKAKVSEMKSPKPEKKQCKKDEKLAPIFCKRSMSSEVEVISMTISPAKLKARQDFLQSGVPDQIKKQQMIERSQEEQLQAWPPFPEVSHVQQRNDSEQIWNLGSPEIKLKPECSDGDSSVADPVGFIYEHRINDLKENNKKTILRESPTLDHASMITILKVLKKSNPRFPVYSAFKFYFDLKREAVESYKRELEKDLNISCVDLTKDEDPKGVGKRKRRSREGLLNKKSKVGKGKGKNIAEIKSCETVTLPLWQERIPDVWTQVYAPRKSSQIIGNKGHIKKLKSWLQEWKGKSEAIAIKEKNKKSKSSKKGGKFIVSDDSDSWEEEEDYISTYLLCGPPGVGKTAAVYALAAELGYKVLEVNASSKRPGKQVMCQLAEATQSHSVSKSSAQQNNSIASLFAAKCNEGKGKKLKEAIHDEGSQGSSKDLDKQKGVSLVLFEDIDVVFDESDEGFLATVNNLIMTTKRPIILTLSHMSHTVLSKIKGNYEKLYFKSPPEDLIAKHLQLISLVNGQHICIEDVQSLVSVNKSDIRQSIMDLQVWNMFGSSTEKCCCISQVDILEDPVVSSEQIARKDILLTDIFPESISTSRQDLELHSACLLGKFHFRNKSGAEYQLKESTENLQRLTWSQVAEHIPFFLPYPLIESNIIQKYPLSPDDPDVKETHLWQRYSWLSLDEDEDDAVPTVVEEKKVEEEPEKVTVPKSVEESSRKCIESLASLYNTFADLDVMDSHQIITLPPRKQQKDHGWWVIHPSAGLSDEEGASVHWAPFGLTQELSEELGQRAFRQCLQDTGRVLESVSSNDWPQFSLPVLKKAMPHVPEAYPSALERLKKEHQDINKGILNIVPLVNHLSRDRHMDYLSCMRTVVRHDELSTIVSNKRRGRRVFSQVSQYGLEISPQDKIKLANALLS